MEFLAGVLKKKVNVSESEAGGAAAAAAGSGKVAVLLGGDFNTDPFDIKGKHTAKAVPELLANTGMAEVGMALKSAYPLPVNEEDPRYTTWKLRGIKEARHVIDYIFYSGAVRPTEILQIPPPKAVDRTRYPGIRYPSDHVAIAAKFVIES